MDTLGQFAQPLAGLDQKIQGILNSATTTKAIAQPTAEPPSEEALVRQVKTTTIALDLISFVTVILLGTYVLIWKNPGYGTIGNYIEALLWGIGLKFGGDVTKLSASDVRTAFGIKMPSSNP